MSETIIVARQRPQVFLPMWVRKEANVHDDVGVERQSVLVAEALDGDLQSLVVADLVEGGDQLGAQLVNVEVGRVDHQIGGVPDRIENRAFELDRFDQTLGLGVEWVLAPRRVVPLD